MNYSLPTAVATVSDATRRGSINADCIRMQIGMRIISPPTRRATNELLAITTSERESRPRERVAR